MIPWRETWKFREPAGHVAADRFVMCTSARLLIISELEVLKRSFEGLHLNELFISGVTHHFNVSCRVTGQWMVLLLCP